MLTKSGTVGVDHEGGDGAEERGDYEGANSIRHVGAQVVRGQHARRCHGYSCTTGSHEWWAVVLRIRMFLGIPDPDPLVRGTDPDPDPSRLKQKL
jgi:hypothetical protein